MIFENVIQCAVDPHCTRGGIVCHCSSYAAARGLVHFVDFTHVDGLAIIRFHFLNQIAIAIVDKLCRLSADGDRNQAVLGIKRLGISQSSFDAPGYAATKSGSN